MKHLEKAYIPRKKEILSRLKDFKKVKGDNLFYELCFCILTPQSSGFKADECIEEFKRKKFLYSNYNPKNLLKKKIRFHNIKTKYLLELKKNYKNIINSLNKINTPEEKRLFLFKNVNGLGLKESSHYLRNTGHENLAILDRHILKNLKKYNVLKTLPKYLTNKKYFEIENKFKKFSKKVNIPMDHLDLLFWAEETGKVFK
ncbi:MAG: N-glycosylase/DNA lyase [Candidatus Woesearchaeota archaeon]